MKNCTFPVRSGRGKCYLCKDLFSNNPQRFYFILKSASNLNGNLNCSKELEHYAS